MRVYVILDFYIDYEVNMEWVKCFFFIIYLLYMFIVVGDVVNLLDIFIIVMCILKEKFQYVFFVVGNYDLWCKSIEGDDVSKMFLLMMFFFVEYFLEEVVQLIIWIILLIFKIVVIFEIKVDQ